MQIPIAVPPAYKFTKHPAIDEIANQVNVFARANTHFSGDIADVEDFIGSILGKDLYWQTITEPESRICLASVTKDGITLNENHRRLFESKPSLLRSCLAHEIGHEVLRHLEVYQTNADQGSLFGETSEPTFVLHDSAWRQFDLTREEIAELRNTLAQKALIDDSYRGILTNLEDKLEPKWMFFQAEQFASCFLIPKARLFECLETGLDITKWPTLYNLAAQFGVSISMLTVRLKKLNLIEIHGKIITRISPLPEQTFAFHKAII